MAGSCDDIKLLLSCQVDKLNRITGNTDREVCVLRLLRMFHRVLQLIKTEYIHVEMMRTLIKISVENMDKVVLSHVNFILALDRFLGEEKLDQQSEKTSEESGSVETASEGEGTSSGKVYLGQGP